MGILAWIVLGLIAGAIAKLLHPGPDPGGILVTMLIGVVGAFVGGLIGQALLGRGVTGFNATSLVISIAGAFLVLVIYRLIVQHRRRAA